jgi:hypothetical protein
MQNLARTLRLRILSLLLVLTVIACIISGTPTPPGPDVTATVESTHASQTPTDTLAVQTDTPSPFPPTPSETASPSPTITITATASPTATVSPTAASPTISPWVLIAGTWSGCHGSGMPVIAGACASPSGPFLTLYVQSHCVIGQYCGNFVKGAFESEFILLKLEFLGMQGSTVWMHGEASGMFSSASTDLTIERVGAYVRIVEKNGSNPTYMLPYGCDPDILASTSIGCYEHVP